MSNRESKNGIIYKITNNINDKVYIGSTIHYTTRRAQHLRSFKNRDTPFKEFVGIPANIEVSIEEEVIKPDDIDCPYYLQLVELWHILYYRCQNRSLNCQLPLGITDDPDNWHCKQISNFQNKKMAIWLDLFNQRSSKFPNTIWLEYQKQQAPIREEKRIHYMNYLQSMDRYYNDPDKIKEDEINRYRYGYRLLEDNKPR